MINLFARLHDRQRAHDALLQMLRKSTLPSLLDTHPPFQIDGNFGATAGIAEMLLQSDADSLHLLPCLPESWTHGSVRGLVARGGIEVDIAWIGGRITEATLRPRFAVERQLRLPTGVTVASIIDVSSGQAVAPTAADDRYHLTGGRTYTLRVT